MELEKPEKNKQETGKNGSNRKVVKGRRRMEEKEDLEKVDKRWLEQSDEKVDRKKEKTSTFVRDYFCPRRGPNLLVKLERYETQGGANLLVYKDENQGIGIGRERGSEETLTGPKTDRNDLKNAS